MLEDFMVVAKSMRCRRLSELNCSMLLQITCLRGAQQSAPRKAAMSSGHLSIWPSQYVAAAESEGDKGWGDYVWLIR